ncbi:hypothetical protein M441DRAFT_28224 [Trichoderma asperellum CBS 433.97]|uniref:Uncharacterized protein n=1 Tax=Trichoderma asperellum (strain ATCC 204424 / CBS 433.97 / NBRC 101777) TaxID=1042311 RepID=A0A2T3Z6N0_TRIA4|nr:hypothetical protein M441DRAFT_28224 [Trichoderma asperellum CBS 433.97]PTB40400.1 hypothetical protein M441DRAFT_28224 [Trichoderma asperellum CBS 433.97]
MPISQQANGRQTISLPQYSRPTGIQRIPPAAMNQSNIVDMPNMNGQHISESPVSMDSSINHATAGGDFSSRETGSKNNSTGSEDKSTRPEDKRIFQLESNLLKNQDLLMQMRCYLESEQPNDAPLYMEDTDNIPNQGTFIP